MILTFLHLVNSATCYTAFTNVTTQSILITRVLLNKECWNHLPYLFLFLGFYISHVRLVFSQLFSFSSYWSAAFVKAINSLRNIWNDQTSIWNRRFLLNGYERTGNHSMHLRFSLYNKPEPTLLYACTCVASSMPILLWAVGPPTPQWWEVFLLTGAYSR